MNYYCVALLQTIGQRAKREHLKEKRKSNLEARLSKIRAKKRLKDGDTKENGGNFELFSLNLKAVLEDLHIWLDDNVSLIH